ncbi:soluble guanylate cyclase 88E-like isoform X3 [Apostichopus japonicus]|uniref:soluble guanylate cyclase 88E-like isoform X3 n=1 Tax=Stichopus japonicus TaxID=307972 RepID=UPI003AB914C3
MYGLIVEGMSEMIIERFGEEAWEVIRDKSRINEYTFVTHRMYSEKIIPRLGQATAEVTGYSYDDVMMWTGKHFVKFLSKYGYEKMLRVLGRNMRDFLNGLDNLHEYLRFSYPKMKPPSFFCSSETKQGLTLQYRSKRHGYKNYVRGQLIEVGRLFYNTTVDVEVVDEGKKGDNYFVVFKMKFDNKEFEERGRKSHAIGDNTMLRSSLLFSLFPFHIVFGADMKVRNAGTSLLEVFPEIVGKELNEVFELKRPFVRFSYDSIQTHENNVFELASRSFITRDIYYGYTVPDVDQSDPAPTNVNLAGGMSSPIIEEDEPEETNDAIKEQPDERRDDDSSEDEILEEVFHPQQLRLKGQMMSIPEWRCYIFLATPLLPNLEAMFNTGLYINDLSMHDATRDLVLAGTQQSAELKLALDQELQKSAQLEESMKKLDQEMKRTDSLLYQMIPRQVADKLRRGEPATSTCEIFREVSILFSDVVGFTTICSRINPMAVVSLLNAMYTKFDKLSEELSVYKVETIGDAYMVVAGAPIITKYHAVLVAEMSLAMLDSVQDLKVPSSNDFVRIRVGIHSGTVVAGVVGLKMPRYCLFGDAVNTASRMESTGEALHVHLSDVTKKHLDEFGDVYQMEERGAVLVKGKGNMKTYWLLGKSLPDGVRDPCEIGKEDVAKNGGRSRSSSLADSPILRRSMAGSRMDTMVVETTENRPRSGSLFSSPIYTPVGFENLDEAAELSRDYNIITDDAQVESNSNDSIGQCLCPMHGLMTGSPPVFADVGIQATDPISDSHSLSDIKGTTSDHEESPNINSQEAGGSVTHSLACILL